MSGTAIYQELTGDDGKRVAIDAWRKYPVPIGRRDDWTSGKKTVTHLGLGSGRVISQLDGLTAGASRDAAVRSATVNRPPTR